MTDSKAVERAIFNRNPDYSLEENRKAKSNTWEGFLVILYKGKPTDYCLHSKCKHVLSFRDSNGKNLGTSHLLRHKTTCVGTTSQGWRIKFLNFSLNNFFNNFTHLIFRYSIVTTTIIASEHLSI